MRLFDIPENIAKKLVSLGMSRTIRQQTPEALWLQLRAEVVKASHYLTPQRAVKSRARVAK